MPTSHEVFLSLLYPFNLIGIVRLYTATWCSINSNFQFDNNVVLVDGVFILDGGSLRNFKIPRPDVNFETIVHIHLDLYILVCPTYIIMLHNQI